MSDDMMWREEDDPELLAAAVAAGVEVQCVAVDGRTWETGCDDSASFRRCMANDCRYRIPAGWSPDTPPADDLRERRVWTCKIGGRVGRLPAGADLPMRRAVADAFTAETGHPVEFCFSGWGDDLDESELAVVEDREPDPEVIRAALVKRLTTLPGGSPTPAPPVPPWPGDENDDTARLTEDQGDRIVNACCRMLGCEPADIDGDAAYEEVLTEAVERCADLHGQDRWEDDCHGCGFRVGDHTTDGRCPPVPPWVVPPCICKSYNLDGQVEGREEVVLDRPTWMPDGERVNGVPVDECIARVVRFLWDNDVRTWGSCCGHNGRYGPPSLLLDRREDIAWVRALIAEVDPRIWHLDWVRTPSPVPPWPGAVLSGLCDEDGVPTWLVQRGQVCGERVRGRVDHGWGVNDYIDTVWVEVRAPRAVPEPETERVPWYRAMGRTHAASGQIVAMVKATAEDVRLLSLDGYIDDADLDGTVEVLRDGAR